jgi:DNA-binding NarL/FixJ family response regulator
VNETSQTIRVVIADGHHMTRAGIRAILEQEPDIEVVGESESFVEVQQLIAELSPDILLLDLSTIDGQPREVEDWGRTNCSKAAIVTLTTHDRDCYLAKTVEAGGVGYLTKDEAPARLVQAIRRAARGEILLTRQQLARANRWCGEVGEQWKRLTQRERQVLQLLMQGLDNATIAGELRIAVKTVEWHVTNILHKLGTASRLQVVVWGYTGLPDGLNGSR